MAIDFLDFNKDFTSAAGYTVPIINLHDFYMLNTP